MLDDEKPKLNKDGSGLKLGLGAFLNVEMTTVINSASRLGFGTWEIMDRGFWHTLDLAIF